MQRRKLGELEVSAVGLGCATMTPFYDAPDPASAIATIHRAREIGVDFLDTADGYGRGRSRRQYRGSPRRARAPCGSSRCRNPGRARHRTASSWRSRARPPTLPIARACAAPCLSSLGPGPAGGEIAGEVEALTHRALRARSPLSRNAGEGFSRPAISPSPALREREGPIARAMGG